MLNIARFKSLLGLQDSAKSLLKPRPHKLGVQFCEVQDVVYVRGLGFRGLGFRDYVHICVYQAAAVSLVSPESHGFTWRFMGSYRWGYGSPNMGYKYSYHTLLNHMGLLGGSWVVVNGVISPLTWVVSIVTLLRILLVTLLITTHEPGCRCLSVLSVRDPKST